MFFPPCPPRLWSNHRQPQLPDLPSGKAPGRRSLAVGACALTLGVLAVEGIFMPRPLSAQVQTAVPAPGSMKSQKTRDMAARLLPFPKEARQELLQSFPRNGGSSSQLADTFEGSWYVHEGDLMIDGDFHSDLNLVVKGNLIVRGTLSDMGDSTSLVVTGDVLAHHILSKQLLVVLGSMHCSGVICADYNDFAFEVWGPAFKSRALVITDRSVSLPQNPAVEYLYNADEADGKGAAEKVFLEFLVRWQDEDANVYRREKKAGKVRWLDEDGEPLDAATAKKLKVVRSIPASIEEIATICWAGNSPFVTAPAGKPDWRLDANADVKVVADHASSTEVQDRIVAAGHPRLTAEGMVRLAADPEPAVRRALVHQAALPEKEAAALSTDKDAGVRRQLAASIHGAPFLDALVVDPSPEIRRACGSHPALTNAQRRKLLQDEEKPVRLRALRYLPVTAAWVKELREAKDEDLVAWAVQHEGDEAVSSDPTMTPGDWKKDLTDERLAVREAALKKGAPAGLFAFLNENRERFLTDKSDQIRRTLAAAVRDEKSLETLAKDTDKYVRRFALDNLAVPPALLIQEARRVAAAPADWWNTSSEKYLDHASDVHDLLEHPRLPEEAVRIIARVYPRVWRLEPRRNMPLDVILERAVIDSASVEFAPGFEKWKQAAVTPGGDSGPVLAAFLETESDYLKSCARMHSLTPVKALLKHAKGLEGDEYSLEEVARSPQLGSDSPEAEQLRQYLLKLPEGTADSELAGNPDVPVEVLKELAKRGVDDAPLTLWQVHGSVP
jgi:hypothetical protein